MKRRTQGVSGGSDFAAADPSSFDKDVEDLTSRRVTWWPNGSPRYRAAVALACVLVPVCFLAENTQSTAYGKFGGADADKIGIALPPRLGWWLMELPVTVTFLVTFFIIGGPQTHEPIPRFLAALVCMHYGYRGWIFPYLIRVAPGATNNFSILPALGGWVVTITHGILTGGWLSTHGIHLRSKSWKKDPRFLFGVFLYLTGFAAVVYHDHLIRELRATPGPRYRIPHGGLFDYATSAGYFSELWAWTGFALMMWGPNGVFILGVSLANLIPRAIVSHQWYLNTFGVEYASLDRAKLVPYFW